MENQPPAYWLTRFMILRLLGILYAVAFLVAINQIVPLIGSNGLLPAGIYFKQVSVALGSAGAGFVRLPSVFWFCHSDTALLTVAWIGFLLSCVVAAGYANVPLLTVLWAALYVLRSCRAGLVWLRLGDPVDRNRLPGDLSLPVA
jgi:hypothetical protein